jgi:hypothetical protein
MIAGIERTLGTVRCPSHRITVDSQTPIVSATSMIRSPRSILRFRTWSPKCLRSLG